MCLCGFIQQLAKFGHYSNSREVKIEVAYFIGQMFQNSRESIQMFISCNGLSILLGLMNLDSIENIDLVMLALDSVQVIFDDQTNIAMPFEEQAMILT